MGLLAGWSKGLGAGEDEEVWSQMRDYWVATGQVSPERAEAIGVDTEDAFREMGLWASWGHGSDWDPQTGLCVVRRAGRGADGMGQQRKLRGVVTVRLKNPRPPEPAAPRWQVIAMTTVWLGGSVVLVAAFVGNLLVQVVR